jgi:hypothetical protein
MAAHTTFIDLTGHEFTRWTVLRLAPARENSHNRFWICECTCGTIREIQEWNLKNTSTSCGCYRSEWARAQIKHGGARDSVGHFPEYRIWRCIRERTMDPRHKSFPNYGGRGIRCCKRWQKSFANFYADMGPRPSPKHSIDRRRNHLGYSPKNCYWATPQQQQRNRRNNVHLTFQGRTQTMVAWAEELQVTPVLLHHRLRMMGWSIKRTLTEPIHKKNLRHNTTNITHS